MRLLLPPSASDADRTVSIDDAYAAPLGSRHDAPWVGLCMVASIDGSTVVDGDSAGLSSDNDTGVLQRLRTLADVIVVGAGTVRGEGYGPPKTPGQRVGVVTASGRIDTTTPLFECGAGFVITTTTTDVDHGIEVVRAGEHDVDLRLAIARLGAVHPHPTFVQAEGGARLNGALLDADLLDEINLTTSPLGVGGSGPRLATDARDHTHRFHLAQLVVDDESFVFSRWIRRPGPSP